MEKNRQRAMGLATGVFLGSLTMLTISDPVQAAIFHWSFSNLEGGINGTVSGWLAVEEGTDVAATAVVLTQTTNPIFNSLINTNFVTLPNYTNQFNVNSSGITAAFFGTDYFATDTNLSLEFNAQVFGDNDSQNLGLLTRAGNPLPTDIGGDGVCPNQCLQTAPLFGDNTGQTQFAPSFVPVPEPLTTLGAASAIALGILFRRGGKAKLKD